MSTISESPAIKLLKIIGCPLLPESQLPVEDSESPELYDYAVRNKIPLLYLEALKRRGELDKLKPQYEERAQKYITFINGISKVSRVFETANIEYAAFKTIKPYATVPGDIDIVIMGNNDNYKKAVEALLRAHYVPEMSDVVSVEALTSDDMYEEAAERLSRPTYGGRHISPSGADFIDTENNVDIDLQKELAVSYIIWLDKDRFRGNIIDAELSNGGKVKTLTPQFDLAVVITHSIIEQLCLLSDYYTLLFFLAQMGERESNDFLRIVKANNLVAATKSFIGVAAALSEAAHGSIPSKMQELINELGYYTREAESLRNKNFLMPHRYKVSTLTRFLRGKLKERKFRDSLLTQMVRMLRPALARQVFSEVIYRRRRETYLDKL